jgi:hypothetical protein
MVSGLAPEGLLLPRELATPATLSEMQRQRPEIPAEPLSWRLQEAWSLEIFVEVLEERMAMEVGAQHTVQRPKGYLSSDEH